MVSVTDGEGSGRVLPDQIPKSSQEVSRPDMGVIQAEVKVAAKDRTEEPVPPGPENAELV